MKRPVSLSLSPNLENADVFLAFKLLFSPWKYFGYSSINQLEQWFKNVFGFSYAISFNSGRNALHGALSALNIQKGDEIILQSFNCVVVPNCIVALGAKPVYVDICDDLTIDTRDLERKITKKTKGIIVQHTFAIPSHMKEISKIAKKNNVYIIEDCAHTVGQEYKNKKLGTFGKISIFSFGRDKAFSSVFGGMAITNNKKLGEEILAYQKKQNRPSFFWVMQQLFHPVAFFLILPLYDFLGIGKILLVVFQKIKFLSFPVSNSEKKGIEEKNNRRKMPNALAELALFQLQKMDRYNVRRKEIASRYVAVCKNLSIPVYCGQPISYLRFPICVQNRDAFVEFFKQHTIYLGKWYSEIIDPKGVEFRKIFYQPGSCQKAESAAKNIVNLPTYPVMTNPEVERVIMLLKQYVEDTGN